MLVSHPRAFVLIEYIENWEQACFVASHQVDIFSPHVFLYSCIKTATGLFKQRTIRGGRDGTMDNLGYCCSSQASTGC